MGDANGQAGQTSGSLGESQGASGLSDRVIGREADRFEREARRRYADLLSSAGVDEGRVSLEVLYLLPPEFVRGYQQLFHDALKEYPSGRGSADVDGRMISKVKNDDVASRRSHIAGSSGKRHQNHWTIRSEAALSVKGKLDKQLRRAIARALGELSDLRRADSEERARRALIGAAGNDDEMEPDDRTESSQQDGSRENRTPRDRSGSEMKTCSTCGLIQSPNWRRCPFHN